MVRLSEPGRNAFAGDRDRFGWCDVRAGYDRNSTVLVFMVEGVGAFDSVERAPVDGILQDVFARWAVLVMLTVHQLAMFIAAFMFDEKEVRDGIQVPGNEQKEHHARDQGHPRGAGR